MQESLQGLCPTPGLVTQDLCVFVTFDNPPDQQQSDWWQGLRRNYPATQQAAFAWNWLGRSRWMMRGKLKLGT
jgi:hypothetical protein